MVRYCGWLALAAALCLAIYVVAADYLALRQHDPAAAPLDTAYPAWQPWGGMNARRATRTGATAWLADPEQAQALLKSAAPRYPLDGGQWLDLARLELQQRGDPERLDALLAIASQVEPNRRNLVWRASQLAIQAGNTERSDQLLRQWQAGSSNLTARALAIAQRWHDDPDHFLDSLLPSFDDDYLVAAMAHARDRQDMALAEAVLARFQGGLTLDHPLFLGHYDFLDSSGRRDEALRLWARYDDHYQAGQVANADFARPLGSPRGLNWRLGRLPDGVSIDLDPNRYYSEPASLRLALDGKHNVRLTAPNVSIPVRPGQRYRLSGQWRAERLSTRSLPYLTVFVSGMRNPRVDVPLANFDWEEWAMEFRASPDTHSVSLRLRRDETTAFDRYIEGYLWIDALRLTPLPDEPEEADDAGV